MIPRGRTSPPGSATATAMVSAWTSTPTLRKFVDIDRLLSHVALRGSVAPDRVTYALRSRAGHYIWTNQVAETVPLFALRSLRFPLHRRFIGQSTALPHKTRPSIRPSI